MKLSRDEFASLMAKLRAHYQNPVTDEALWLASVSTYWNEIKDFDAEKVRTAFAIAWKKHPDWMPSCGQLVDLIQNDTRDSKLRALQAWAAIFCPDNEDAYRIDDTVSDVDRDIGEHAVLIMGGTRYLERQKTEWLNNWGKREFVEIFCGVAEEVRRGVDVNMLLSTNPDYRCNLEQDVPERLEDKLNESATAIRQG